MTTRKVDDDLDETQPFPPSVLDERWEWGPPVAAIRAALAEEPENREAVTEVLSRVADEVDAEARRKLVGEIAAFVESRASDRAEGERLAGEIRSAFSGPAGVGAESPLLLLRSRASAPPQGALAPVTEAG